MLYKLLKLYLIGMTLISVQIGLKGAEKNDVAIVLAYFLPLLILLLREF